MSAGEVGRAGVSVASLRDMETIFEHVPVSSVARVGMLGNSIGPIALALFVALGERQGVAIGDFVVDLQNDPLKEYVARGTQFLPIEPAVKLAADVVEWCAHEAPHFFPLDVCVNHINAAGAGSTAGTAFAIGNAIHYIEELLGRGLPIDSFAPQMQLFLDEREDFFVAIANIRATRRIWAELMRDRFGAHEPESLALAVTAYGHGRETRLEPLNNIVRIALGSLAYYLAGIQTMYTASYDEVIQTPSDEAVKIAIRTQQIMGLELGLRSDRGPARRLLLPGGADRRDRGGRSATRLPRWSDEGGAVTAINSGLIRGVIAEGAVRRQDRFEAGLRPMVGVDRLQSEDGGLRRVGDPADPRHDRGGRGAPLLRRSASSVAHASSDGPLGAARRRAALKRGENSVPTVLEAVRVVCDRRRDLGRVQGGVRRMAAGSDVLRRRADDPRRRRQGRPRRARRRRARRRPRAHGRRAWR